MEVNLNLFAIFVLGVRIFGAICTTVESDYVRVSMDEHCFLLVERSNLVNSLVDLIKDVFRGDLFILQ